MIDVFDFFSSSNGREALKRAIISNHTFCDICGFVLYTNKKDCPFEEDGSECSSCPFDMEYVSTIQKIRSLWVGINMHSDYDNDDWYWVNIKNALSNILYDLTHDWVFHRDITRQVREIRTFSETVRLLEIVMSICDEIEE